MRVTVTVTVDCDDAGCMKDEIAFNQSSLNEPKLFAYYHSTVPVQSVQTVQSVLTVLYVLWLAAFAAHIDTLQKTLTVLYLDLESPHLP